MKTAIASNLLLTAFPFAVTGVMLCGILIQTTLYLIQANAMNRKEKQGFLAHHALICHLPFLIHRSRSLIPDYQPLPKTAIAILF